MLRGKLGKKAMAICLAASSVLLIACGGSTAQEVEHRTVQQKEQRLLPRRLEQISRKTIEIATYLQVIH